MLTSLGSGATSNSYTDYEDAGCLVVIGCDPTSNHPVAASRMRRAVVERGAKLIVINPRRIDMCDYADIWMRPQPGTDVALLNGLANVIVAEGLTDSDFVDNRTEGFDEWAEVVAQYSPERVEQITGVPAEDIRQAARVYARPPLPLSLTPGSCLIWGMGITQHTNGTANAHGLVNLALAAGQLGRPGSGISPLRGQNNVQGCGDAGCLPNSLPGYQGLGLDTLAKFHAAWGAEQLPEADGLVVTDMVTSMDQPNGVKAMYITGENPLLSEPDLNHAAELFQKLEFLVVQDIFMHETAEIADVVLPATSFAEKDGTFTNSERRVQRVRKAIEPRGQSRPDWEIICDLGRRMCRKLGLPLEDQFTYDHPSQIFDEMARLTPIIAGISYHRLDAEGGIQWPCPDPGHPGTPYLYAGSFPRGPRAKFVPYQQGPVAAEMPNRRFPLILNTGRTLYHWHGGTITRRVAGLLARSPELQVAINPEDGDKYGLEDGQWIRVSSRRGQLTGRALFTDRMRAGEIFVPFVKLSESAANFLTNAVYDPESKIPEYKVCAVRVEALESPNSEPAPSGQNDSQGKEPTG
jgi:predicted molibdopterin-dependent oxidoreductase YjgC